MHQTSTRKPVDFEMFRYTRVTSRRELPPADAGIVDVVLLDMNFGLPNLGHDSLVHAIHESAQPLEKELGLELRILSFDVRRSAFLPDTDLDRFRLFVGTGGPGHLDPRRNTGVEEWCEGVCETADWEEPLFELFDRIRADDRMALIGFCHSFGIICRWAGIGEPVLRGPSKGKSQGIVMYRLTDAALEHPWFARFSSELVDAPNFRVLDSRLFDLFPSGPLPEGALLLATEQTSPSDEQPAMTMVELERHPDGLMPRILGANHHPEVVDLHHLEEVLDEKLERGEITEQWHNERGSLLRSFWNEPDTDERMRRTSRYTLLEPVQFHIRNAMLERLENKVQGV